MYTPTKSWLDITNQGQGTSGIEETNHHHIDTQATGKIHKAIHSYIINIFLGPCPYVQPHPPFTLQRTRRRHLKTFAQARILLTNLGAALGAPSWKQNSRQCPTLFFCGPWFNWWKSFSCGFCWGQHYISMCNKEYACDWHLRSTFARNGFDSSLAARRSISVRITLCFLFFCLLQQLAAPQDQVGNAALK